MDREVFVYIDLQGTPQLMGTLWARLRKGRESATFDAVAFRVYPRVRGARRTPTV